MPGSLGKMRIYLTDEYKKIVGNPKSTVEQKLKALKCLDGLRLKCRENRRSYPKGRDRKLLGTNKRTELTTNELPKIDLSTALVKPPFDLSLLGLGANDQP